jgi:chemotaxis protein MotB
VANVDLIKDQAVRITLTDDLLFETGKAELKKGSLKVLDQVSAVIKQTPYIVNVVGHTDDMPIHTPQFPTNWELSAIRACVVVRYMIENMGIPGERFFISAHSYYEPVKPNNNQSNRSGNRRVDIIITKERP